MEDPVSCPMVRERMWNTELGGSWDMKGFDVAAHAAIKFNQTVTAKLDLINFFKKL